MGNYYIKLEDGPDVRRKLLESSKAGLHILQSHQKLKIIRSEKLTSMNQLRMQMKELNVLLNRVDALLPELTDAEAKELFKPQLPKPLEFNAPLRKENAVKNSSKTVFIKVPKKPVNMKFEKKLPSFETEANQVDDSRPLTELEKLQKALEEVEGKLDKL